MVCLSADNLLARGTKEEGILRVAGNKQKTEQLYAELEQNFYAKHDKSSMILQRAGVHDLSALLKRWLRELPTPLLANDLVHLFYQTAGNLPPIYHSLHLNANKSFIVICRYSAARSIQGNVRTVFAVAPRKPEHVTCVLAILKMCHCQSAMQQNVQA